RPRSFRSDSSICAIPSFRPLVQTFVAMNSFSRSPSFTASSPATASERPYIGDESSTRPPSATKSESTSSSRFRSLSAEPTSNVCHVPMPMTGRGFVGGWNRLREHGRFLRRGGRRRLRYGGGDERAACQQGQRLTPRDVRAFDRW